MVYIHCLYYHRPIQHMAVPWVIQETQQNTERENKLTRGYSSLRYGVINSVPL